MYLFDNNPVQYSGTISLQSNLNTDSSFDSSSEVSSATSDGDILINKEEDYSNNGVRKKRNEDDKENDELEIDEGASFTDEFDNDHNQTFQIEMRTKTKDEKILYEFHSYLSERNINEETNIMTVEDDNILWDVKYSSNVYERFYDSLIEYINENFLSENLVVYLNGEKVEAHSINLIK